MMQVVGISYTSLRLRCQRNSRNINPLGTEFFSGRKIIVFICLLSLNQNIRLSTKFWRFFQKFYFCFFTSKVQLVFRYIFTITIYHLSPMFWQRCDPALVEVLGFFIKELDKFRFDIAFVLELFIT